VAEADDNKEGGCCQPSRREDWSEPLRDAARLRENILFSLKRIYPKLRKDWARVVGELGLDGVAVVLHERPPPAEPDPEARGLTLCAVFSEEGRKRIGVWMGHLFPRWQVEVSPVKSGEPLVP
jgi:hypothetical protein